MESAFTRALEHLLHGGASAPPPRPAMPPRPAVMAETIDSRHRRWFAHYAEERVLPLLSHAVEALRRRGFAARCRLVHDGDAVTGELVITPAGLPAGAMPPRFAVSAAAGPSGLSIDYTGSFPSAGAEGGFGAEIVYDTVTTGELEEQLLEFVRMATRR